MLGIVFDGSDPLSVQINGRDIRSGSYFSGNEGFFSTSLFVSMLDEIFSYSLILPICNPAF